MFNPSLKLNNWWLIVTVMVAVAAASAVLFNTHQLFWKNDITYLSSGILLTWILATINIGVQIFKNQESTEYSWFIADSFLTIGMIGTVIGFVYMLSTTFTSLDPTDVNSMKAAISTMAAGMGTALLTTLAGLISSLTLKVQLIIQDK
jgi:flagellar motor component MotA